MKNKQPYKLKAVLICYNLFQILSCTFLVYKIVTPLSKPHYSLNCEKWDYSEDLRSLNMLKFCFYFYCLKVVDLVETLFFVLRKKHNQVSKLHVYHHISSLLICWLTSKYFGGSMTTFNIALNSFVHAIMYFYFLLSSLGTSWQKYTIKWKPILTMFQMMQFCIMIIHTLQGFSQNCKAPKLLFYIYTLNVMVVFGMFLNFYKTSYLGNNKSKSA